MRPPGQAALLGDTSSSGGEFQSPEEYENTDYGLQFSTLRISGPSTSRIAQAANIRKNQPTARKRTGRLNLPPPAASNPATAPGRPPQPIASESGRRKKRKPMYNKVWKDIKELQNSTRLLIPRAPFSRLVREIIMDTSPTSVTKISIMAMEALRESTETYVTQQLQDAYTLTLHRGRVTLSVKDLELLRFLRGAK